MIEFDSMCFPVAVSGAKALYIKSAIKNGTVLTFVQLCIGALCVPTEQLQAWKDLQLLLCLPISALNACKPVNGIICVQ